MIKYDYYAESILIKFDDVLDYSPLRGFILPIRPIEMKKILGEGGGGSTNYEILSATMVGQRRKFFISIRLKGLDKLNICRR